MKNVLEIFRNDLKEVFSKVRTWVLIIGLIFLPSVYAWPNIISTWDPYSHTNQLKVAVVSTDSGTMVEGKEVNVGKGVIDGLKENKSLSWQFVNSREEAVEGVKIGNYYASIVIPENFSQDMTSVTRGKPKKAKIEYTVNEKINAISPKIANNGASAIANNISKNFVETANGAIFEKLHEVGIEYENNLPTIKKIREQVRTLNDNFGTYQAQVSEAIGKVEYGQSVLATVQNALPEVDRLATNSIMIADKTGVVINNIEGFNEKLLPTINSHLKGIEEVSKDAVTIAEEIKNKPSNTEQVKEKMASLNQRYDASIGRLDLIHNILSYFNNLSSNSVLESHIQRVDNLKEDINNLKNINTDLYNNIDKYEEIKQEAKDRFAEGTKTFDSKVNSFDETLNSKVAPAVSNILSTAGDKISKVSDIIFAAQSELPAVSDRLAQASGKMNNAYAKLIALNNALPEIKEKLEKTNDKFNELEKQVDQEAIDTLLGTSYKEQADFFANPLEIENYKLFPIENYGSAMTPFYTALSIWVGALLMSSLLTTKVEDEENKYKPYEKYLGRAILFTIISVLQASVISLGNMFLLGTQAVSHYRFFFYSLLIAMLFSMIIYTIVSILGNIGKAVCIIFLVLQMGASGGTFPIQMTPSFFQWLYPKVPFSYAISLLREAVGGVYMPAVYREIKFLFIAYVITLSVGLTVMLLRGRLNKSDEEKEKSKLFL